MQARLCSLTLIRIQLPKIDYWRVQKGHESLAPKIKKKLHPSMIPPYKSKKLFRNFFFSLNNYRAI